MKLVKIIFLFAIVITIVDSKKEKSEKELKLEAQIEKLKQQLKVENDMVKELTEKLKSININNCYLNRMYDIK